MRLAGLELLDVTSILLALALGALVVRLASVQVTGVLLALALGTLVVRLDRVSR